MKNKEYIIDIKDTNKVIILNSFNEIKPTEELAQKLNIPYFLLCFHSNYVSVNGTDYFFKQPLDTKYLLSELLGVELSKFMGLKTIEYRLLSDRGSIIGLLSKNFRKPSKNYISSYHLSKDDLNLIITTLTERKYDNTPFKNELARFLIRNFYAAETDSGPNVLCEKKQENISLAPLFDYEHSFRNIYLEKYEDDLFIDNFGNNIKISFDFLSRLLDSSDIQSSLKKVLLFNMRKALANIEDNQGIKIPEILISSLTDFDEKRKKFMISKLNF